MGREPVFRIQMSGPLIWTDFIWSGSRWIF